MNLGFSIAILDKFSFFVLIEILNADRIVVVPFPVAFGSFSAHNLIISGDLNIVLLQILVRHHIVVTSRPHRLILFLFLFCNNWAIFRRLKVMFFNMDVANDVELAVSISFGTEIPWLFLRIGRPFLQALKFVVKIQNVVGLLVTESAILILGQSVNHGLRLNFLLVTFFIRFIILLSDRIINRV